MRPGNHRRGCGRREAGFTYLGLLALIALIGYLLAVAGEISATTEQREREKQLLFVGHEYRNAIGRFFRQNHHFPQTLEELLQFENSGPQPAHYLRRLYPDPMTRGTDWVLFPAPGQGIMGVASASTKIPLKRAGFDDEDFGFDVAETYANWVFLYDPRSALLRKLSPGGAVLPH
jgi:type II secretory pathway pseudopilin PulG